MLVFRQSLQRTDSIDERAESNFITESHIVKALLDTLSTFPVQSHLVSHWPAASLPSLEVHLLIALLLQLSPLHDTLVVDPQHYRNQLCCWDYMFG